MPRSVLPPLRPTLAQREVRLAAVAARLHRRRHHARIALGLFLGRCTDAEIDSLADAKRLCRVVAPAGDTFLLAQAEKARREALDCPYQAHVEENPYDGVVRCHGCGIVLFTVDSSDQGYPS